MKYLWTEDTGAGLHFWQLVNELFFNGELKVESKESNQGLLETAYHRYVLQKTINIILHLTMWLIIRIFVINTDFLSRLPANRINIL